MDEDAFLEMEYEDRFIADTDIDPTDEYVCNWCGNYSDDCECA